MKKIEMIKGAKKLVDECTNVKEGENVLIITDTNMPLSIAETLAIACRERGAEGVIIIMSPNPRDGMEPPPTVAGAMEKAQVIFQACSKGILHTQATKRASEAGARGVTIVDFTEENMFRGSIEANFLETKELVDRVGDVLRKAKEARITTPAGTDIYLDLRGQEKMVRTLNCVCHQPGEWGVPALEASISPKIGRAQGVIVCDAAVTLLRPGIVNEPIRAIVKDGKVTGISGGVEAKKLLDLLVATGDPMVYNVAELGIGLNPKAKITGVQTQDEGVYGTCHIGCGSNITWGGDIKAATHFDFVMYAPKIELDGITVLENYQFKL
jgi:leucyl aminopeptidase (aminopeptidase T)